MRQWVHLTYATALFGFLCFGSAALAQTTTITKAQISFTFVANEVDGTIAGFESKSSLTLEDLGNSQFLGSVDVTTIDTDNRFRDWHLKRRKYFNADAYPRISFESSSVREVNGQYIVAGLLNLKGTEKPMTIVFQRTNNQLVGTTSLYTSDFGISIKKKREDNLVNVKFIFDIN